jgi:hypothetical protein
VRRRNSSGGGQKEPWSAKKRAEAMRLAEARDAAWASRKTGVPAGTIRSWLARRARKADVDESWKADIEALKREGQAMIEARAEREACEAEEDSHVHVANQRTAAGGANAFAPPEPAEPGSDAFDPSAPEPRRGRLARLLRRVGGHEVELLEPASPPEPAEPVEPEPEPEPEPEGEPEQRRRRCRSPSCLMSRSGVGWLG